MSPSAAPSRRAIVAAAAGAAFTGGCATEARRRERLRYLLRRDVNTIDPVTSPEEWLLAAVFEPLIQLHPDTMEPMAGLATHYLVQNGGTRYTFYLRGHASPRGVRLASADSLPAEFTRGLPATPFEVAAHWSDGTIITADDCVFSWRRYFDPASANADAGDFYCVAGGQDVVEGIIPPERLGVRALDRFAFQIDLVKPAPYFLLMCRASYPTPRHIIEAARWQGRESSWAEPGRIATSGPFRLKEFRPHERTVVARNPYYFDAHFSGVDEIEFSSADGATVVSLFQAGLADSMEGRVLPLQLAPRLKGQAALNVRAANANHSWRVATHRPPLNNLALRLALNLATDKVALAGFLGVRQSPAKTRVPQLPGYSPPTHLTAEIDGRTCDVLGFNPRVAREIWNASTPTAPARLAIHYPARMDSRLLAEIQQQQWRQNLGLEADLQAHEPAAYTQMAFHDGDFTGVAEDPYMGHPDPFDFMNVYTTARTWSDPAFNAQLNAASAITAPALRMSQLADCERALLRAMPLIPLYFDTWVYLERPDLHGMRLSPVGVPAFKYAWIEPKLKGRVQ